MKSITKRIISTLAICGALVLEAGATAIGSLGKALNNIAKVDAADTTLTWSGIKSGNAYGMPTTASTTEATNNNFNGLKVKYNNLKVNSGYFMVNSNNGYIYNYEAVEGSIKSLKVSFNTGSVSTAAKCKVSLGKTSGHPCSGSSKEVSQSAGGSVEVTDTGSNGYSYFAIESTVSGKNIQVAKIELTYSAKSTTGYTVSFDANSGSGSQDDLTSETSGTFTLPATTTFNAPEGKAFDGWGTGTASSTKITTSQWTIPESGKTATLYALWKDVSYTDLPAGTYPIKIDYSGVTAGDTVPSTIYYTIKEDSDPTFYKKAKVEYSGVTASYAGEYSWKASSHKMTFSSNSNAKVTKLSVKYYKANDLTVKNAAGTVITGTSIESVTNYNIKEYNINSTGFSLNGPSSGTMSVYEMTATLVVEDDSSVTDVINEINALPTAAYTQEFADKLNSALDHYNKLSASDQALVTNHNKLLTAQSSFNELRDAAVSNVETLITQIGTVTADSGTKISAARTAYNALLADTLGKSLVSNYSTLTAAEATYQDALAVKAVEDAIKALPEAANITDYSHHTDIAAARAAYKALTDDQKAMVTASLVTKLEACEDAEKPYAPKEVTFYYNDSVSTSTNMTGNNDAEKLNADASEWEIKGYKGGHDLYPGLNKACNIRMYYHANGNNYIVIKPLIEDAKITTMTVNLNSGSPCKTIIVSNSSSTLAPASGVYTVNDTEVTILSGATSNQQVYIDSIVCAYSVPTTSNITYNNLKGATNSNPSTYVEGIGVESLDEPGSITGYTFQGWYDNASCAGDEPITSIPTTQTGDVELWAKWQINSHTYKIVYNNGTDDLSSIVEYNTSLTAPAAPSKTGYEFLHWNNGTENVAAGAEFKMPDNDYTLTAVYNIKSYAVKFFDADGDLFEDYGNRQYLSKIELPATNPTKSGMTFIGWAETSGASEASWATGTYEIPDHAVNFYPVFTDEPAITGVTLANTFTSIELTEANNSFSATVQVSVTPNSLDTTIDWSVSPVDAGSFTNTTTNSGVSPVFTANKLYDEVTIKATSHGDNNYYETFTFSIVNPADEYVSDIVIIEGTGVRKAYYSSETAVDMTGLTADATYKSTARPLYEDTRDVTSLATWTLDIANKKVIASLGGETDYIAIEVVEKAIDHIVVDSQPSKTSYTIGDAFNPDGMVVKAIYNDASEEPLTSDDYTVDVDMFAHGSGDSVTTPVTIKLNDSELAADPFNITISKFKPSTITKYKLVEDVSDLKVGDELIFYTEKDEEGYVSGAFDSKYLTSVSGASVSDKVLTLPEEGAQLFTLGGDSSGWTFSMGEDKIGTTAAKTLTLGNDKATNTWTISIADGIATVTSTNDSFGRFLYNYNGGNPRYLNYTSNTSASMILPSLYKKVTESSGTAKLVKFDATLKDDSVRIAGVDTVDVSSFNFKGLKNDATSATIDTTKVTMISSGNLVAGDNDIEFSYEGLTYHAHCNVKAKSLVYYDLTVNFDDATKASYEVDPEITDNKMVDGEDYTVTITPAGGYKIKSITADGASVSGNVVTIIDASQDIEINVTTEKIAYSYDFTTNVKNCTISSSKVTPEYGDEITITVDPHADYLMPETLEIKDGTGTALEIIAPFDASTGEMVVKVSGDGSIVAYTSTTKLPLSVNGDGVSIGGATTIEQGESSVVLGVTNGDYYDINTLELLGFSQGGAAMIPVDEFTADVATYDETTHTLTIKNVSGAIVVYAKVSGKEVNVDVSGIDTDNTVKINSMTEEARLGESFVFSLETKTHDYKGLVIHVYMGGTEITDELVLGDTITIDEVTGDIKITAVAEKVKYTVTSLEHVSLQGGATQEGWADYQGEFKLFFDPDEGYKVTGISYTNNGVEGSSTAYSPFKVETVNGVLVITPVVEAIEYKITGSESTKDMVEYSFTSEGPYHYGDVVTVTFTVKEGYEIIDEKYSHYTMGGMQYNFEEYGDTSVEITITDDVIISPAVNVIMHAVDIIGDNHDLGTFDNVEYADYWHELEITFTPKENKQIVVDSVKVTMGGDDVTNSAWHYDESTGIGTVTLVVKGNVVIDIDFAPITAAFDITDKIDDVLIVYPTDTTVKIGEEFNAQITIPDYKYEFDKDSVKVTMMTDGVETDVTEHVVSYEDSDATLKLAFTGDYVPVGVIKVTTGIKLIDFTVTVEGDDELVSLSGDTVIAYGKTATIKVTPIAHYHFKQEINVIDSGNASYTLSEKQADGSYIIYITTGVEGNVRISVSLLHDNVSVKTGTLNDIKFTFQTPHEDLEYGSTVTGYFVADPGFKLPTIITVTCYGETLDSDQYTYNEGTFSIEAMGDIVISAAGSQRNVGFSLVNTTEEGKATLKNPLPEELNSGYTIDNKLVAPEGYVIDTVVVTMGGNVIKNAYDASTGGVYVYSISDDVVITVTTRALDVYDITATGNGVAHSVTTWAQGAKVTEGAKASYTFKAAEGYDISVTATGAAVTYSNGVYTVTITNASSDVVITVNATAKEYAVTYNLENATCSGATTVSYGGEFNATIAEMTGYTLEGAFIEVKMNGQSVQVVDGVIDIDSVTGPIVITVRAVAIQVNITYTLNGVANVSNKPSSVAYGSKFETTVTFLDGYKDLVVKVNGVVGQYYDSETGVISIANVTGAISIETTATRITYEVDASGVNNAILSGASSIDFGGSYQATLSPDVANGYDSLTNVVVKMADSTGAYVEVVGAYTDGRIYIELVTGDIKVLAEGVEATFTITTDLVNVELAPTPSGEYKYSQSYSGTITFNAEGYNAPTIVVTVNGVEHPEFVDGYVITITNVSGNVEISAVAEGKPQEVEIIIDVENISLPGIPEDIKYGDLINTIVVVDEGYVIDDVRVFINEDDVTDLYVIHHEPTKASRAAMGEYYEIKDLVAVPGIKILVESSPVSYEVDVEGLENVVSTGSATAPHGASYVAQLKPAEGYENVANIVVYMVIDGVSTDITATAVVDNYIFISKVTGDITISASASIKHFSIESSLTHASNSNDAISADYGTAYNATIAPETGYTNLVVTVMMGGADVTADVYSNGVISIAKVTGEIQITASAELSSVAISYNLSNVSSSTDVSSVMYNEPFEATFTVNEGYFAPVITVTMGGEQVTVVDGHFAIEHVTGEIVINASATKIELQTISAVANVEEIAYGGTFTAENVTVTGHYNDGVDREIDSSLVTIEGFVATQVGEQEVTVKVDELNAKITISVKASEEIQSITAVVVEGKEELEFDAPFTVDDVVVTATYTDGHTAVVAAESVDFAGEVGENTVVVHVGELTCEVTVTVKASEVITGIEVSTEKSDVQYGTSFTKDDVKAQYVYSDGHKVDATVDSISGFSSTTLGAQTITVTVGEYTATLEITVSGQVALSIEIIGYNDTIDQGKDYVFDGKVIAHYNDNTSGEVTGFNVEAVDTSTSGKKTVKVTFEGVSATFEINVVQTKPNIEPTYMTAIIGGSVVGVAVLAVGIFLFLKMFKL